MLKANNIVILTTLVGSVLGSSSSTLLKGVLRATLPCDKEALKGKQALRRFDINTNQIAYEKAKRAQERRNNRKRKQFPIWWEDDARDADITQLPKELSVYYGGPYVQPRDLEGTYTKCHTKAKILCTDSPHGDMRLVCEYIKEKPDFPSLMPSKSNPKIQIYEAKQKSGTGFAFHVLRFYKCLHKTKDLPDYEHVIRGGIVPFFHRLSEGFPLYRIPPKPHPVRMKNGDILVISTNPNMFGCLCPGKFLDGNQWCRECLQFDQGDIKTLKRKADRAMENYTQEQSKWVRDHQFWRCWECKKDNPPKRQPNQCCKKCGLSRWTRPKLENFDPSPEDSLETNDETTSTCSDGATTASFSDQGYTADHELGSESPTPSETMSSLSSKSADAEPKQIIVLEPRVQPISRVHNMPQPEK